MINRIFVDFNSLIKEILDGKRCIQEPIVVNNYQGEKAEIFHLKHAYAVMRMT